MVLGAIYAVERLAPESRRVIAPLLHQAMRWRGPVGPALITHLAGTTSVPLSALADPRAWAMDVLGFPVGSPTPTRRQLTAQFRLRMRSCTPTTAATSADAGTGDARPGDGAPDPRRGGAEVTADRARCCSSPVRAAAAISRRSSRVDRGGQRAARLVGGARRLPVPQGGSAGAGQAGGADGRRPRGAGGDRQSPQRRRRRALDGRADLLDGRRRCRRRSPPPKRLLGVVTISYPLHPPGRPDRLRVEHLPDVAVPWLFVHGTRDPFGSPDELQQWTATIAGPVTHHWLDGGHDLKGKDAAGRRASSPSWVPAL